MSTYRSTITAIVVALIIIVSGFFLLQRDGSEKAGEIMEETEEVSEDTINVGETVVDEGPPSTSADPDETTETTGSGGTQEESEPVSSETPAPESSGGVEETIVSTVVTVTYTNDGFSPSTVTISTGDTVTFINESSSLMWPASIFHPTHRIYPGSSIQKCGTSEEGGIFDSCTRIISGDSWSFTFNEIGSWKYHNHLNASKTGTIVVK